MTNAIAATTGLGLVFLTLVVVLAEWGAGDWANGLQSLTALVLLLVLAPQVRRGRQVFVAVGIVLTIGLAFQSPDWVTFARVGLEKAAFIGAFFCALASLRSVAEGSPAIQNAGRFLALQPPGRRYIALTFGGQVFALVLNYGAIALLGGLATASAKTEQNPEIRQHRTRRMLLAIQRGFGSTLPWSPLSFAVAITTAIIPGTTFVSVAVPGMVTGFLMAVTGWALDTIFKPRIAGSPRIRQAPEGNWMLMSPLLILLITIMGGIGGLYMLTGIRVVGLVILLVPTVAIFWVLVQSRSQGGTRRFRSWFRAYVFTELPAVKGEVVLLMMAGYIGTVGSALLVPAIAASGLDLSGVPTSLILVAFVFVIPAAGQIGINPILAVTLLVPVIPSAELLGVTPTAVVVALTAGWALSGMTSPFTASTLMVGAFGEVPARHVGLVWNGGYFLVASIIVSIWVLGFAGLLA